MTDYLDQLKALAENMSTERYTPNDEQIKLLAEDFKYLIRRLEEREHKVKELNEKLKGCRKK